MTTPLSPPAAEPTRRPRRGVLAALLAVPVVAGLAPVVAAGRRSIPFLRPAGVGSSTECCAQCGAGDHTMLDPSCPAAPEVL